MSYFGCHKRERHTREENMSFLHHKGLTAAESQGRRRGDVGDATGMLLSSSSSESDGR
jgi:hypothetical protein